MSKQILPTSTEQNIHVQSSVDYLDIDYPDFSQFNTVLPVLTE